jgi:hypothetical protein
MAEKLQKMFQAREFVDVDSMENEQMLNDDTHLSFSLSLSLSTLLMRYFIKIQPSLQFPTAVKFN